MLRRLIAGVALVLISIGPAAAELADYKNIGPKEIVGRIVRDLAGDDVEVRRAASDELKSLAEKNLSGLGTDPEAEKSLYLIGDGIAELFWMGKATSRTRAERTMDDLVGALGLAVRSADKPKANSAHKVMVRYISVLLRNAEHPSSSAAIAELKKHLKAWPDEDIKPAQEVVSFLTEAPEEKKPAAAEPVPPPKTPPAEEKTAEQASKPEEPSPAPAPKPSEPEATTVVAPEKSRSVEQKPAEREAPVQKARIVDSAAWKYADPALKVTTVVAPAQSRIGASKDMPAAASSTAPASLKPSSEPRGDGTSILNILQAQLSSEDEKRLEAGLKLTSKTSDEVVNHLNHGSDERSKAIIKRVRTLVDHKSPAVKRQAMKTAAALKDNLAAPQIAANLESQDEATAKTAYESLKAISNLDLGPTREPWAKWAAEQR